MELWTILIGNLLIIFYLILNSQLGANKRYKYEHHYHTEIYESINVSMLIGIDHGLFYKPEEVAKIKVRGALCLDYAEFVREL